MSTEDIKRAFYRHLLSVGKSDSQARRIIAYIEKESPINFFKRVGVSKKQYRYVLHSGGFRSLTRHNKEIFSEVYRLYGGFVDRASAKQMRTSGPGRAGILYDTAAQIGEELKMAITKAVLLFCMLFALCGDWLSMERLYGSAWRGYTLLEIGATYRSLWAYTTAPFALLLTVLIIAIVISCIVLLLVIRQSGRVIIELFSTAGSIKGFLSFCKYFPPIIYLAAGVIAFIFSIVFLSSFTSAMGIGIITGAPVFLLIVAIILIIIVVTPICKTYMQRSPRRYFR